MSASRGSSPVTRAVAVTGASGYLGALLVRKLLAEPGIERVVGVDIRPAAVRGERHKHFLQDVRAPLDEAFAGADAVAHLAFLMRQPRDRAEGRSVNVGGAENAARACAAAGVRRAVLMSSATVYGAWPDNPPLLTEDAPLRPPPGFAYAEDKAEAEAVFRALGASRPDVCVSILRGCVVMGPNADNFITSALNKPALIAVRGADPPMQFVHEDDLVALLVRFLMEDHPGAYNVAAPGSVRWREAAALAGKRIVPMPAPLARGLTELTWRMRLQSDAPAAGLSFIRWPWMASAERVAAETTHRFAYTSREALLAYLGRDGGGHRATQARLMH